VTLTLTISALVVVVAAAVRSTWSPCGWSMLSTITPMSERARGHRFAATAAWFVAGSIAGGAVLGAVGAVAALGVQALGPSTGVRLGLAAVAALVAAGFDAGVMRPALPHLRRQVDESWLDEFRPWVYGGGFGAQIGFGLATYVMSAGVYLVVVLGALSSSAAWAVVLGLAFGAVRGAAVLAGVGSDTPARLAAFHRRFAAAEAPVRAVVAAVLAAVGVVLAGAAGGALGVVAAAVVVAAVALAGARRSRAQRRGATATPASASFTTPASAERRASEPTTA
jgi:hypothetical protein